MWKIIFNYTDGGRLKLTNSVKPIDARLASKYLEMYGRNSDGGFFQQYPVRKYKAIPLREVVEVFQRGDELEKVILREDAKGGVTCG